MWVLQNQALKYAASANVYTLTMNWPSKFQSFQRWQEIKKKINLTFQAPDRGYFLFADCRGQKQYAVMTRNLSAGPTITQSSGK